MSIILPGQLSHSNPDFAIADIKDVRGGIKSVAILDTPSLFTFSNELDKFLTGHSIIIERTTNRMFRLSGLYPLDLNSWDLISTVFNGLEVNRMNLESYSDIDDLVDNINRLPTFTVDNNVIQIFNGVLQDPNMGNFIQKHFLVSQELVFGISGSTIGFENLELFYQQDLSSLGSANNIVAAINPSAVNYDLGIQSTNDIAYLVNNSGPYNLNDDDDVYFSFIESDSNYIFRFLISASGSYGMSASGVTQSDFLEFYNSNVDAFIEGTYDEIFTLKSNSLLIPNKSYIITDYQHKYIIPYTDTSRSIVRVTSIGAVSGYLQFVISNVLANGTIFTVVSLPSGYSGTSFIGQTGSITSSFGSSYYIFTTFQENATNIGVTFEYELPRYTSEFDEVTLFDYYGNIICQPGGVVNTDVHNGQVYGTMSVLENTPPPIERIVLTATSPNKFSLNCYSDTFENDTIEYDINDKNIYDYNGNLVVTRKGFILRRSNKILNIDMNKDWRSQKYRRYRTTDVLFDRYKNLEEVYRCGSDYVGGMVNSLYNSTGHRYSLLDMENPFHINDFTGGSASSNLFNSSLNNIALSEINMFTNAQSQIKYTYSFNIQSSGLMFKDFNIIPLDINNNPKPIIKKVSVMDLDNTVFMDNIKNFGTSDRIDVDSSLGSIKSSTFLSGMPIYNTKEMEHILTFDIGGITNYNEMGRVRLMSNNAIINHGIVYNVGFGSRATNSNAVPQYFDLMINSDSKIINSIVSANYAIGLKLIDCSMSSSLLHLGVSYHTRFTFKGHLTAFRDSNSSTSINLLNASFNLNTGLLKNPSKVNSYGYDYNFVATNEYRDRVVETSNSKELYIVSSSENRQITITSSVTLNELNNNVINKVKSSVVITIPSGLSKNYNTVFRTYGATATFVGSGVTIDAPTGLVLPPYKMATLFKDGSDESIVITGEMIL